MEGGRRVWREVFYTAVVLLSEDLEAELWQQILFHKPEFTKLQHTPDPPPRGEF